MSGSVTVETLPVNVLTRQVLEDQHKNATQRPGKEESQGRYDITRTLTIWLRLQGKSEGGGGGGRGHKLKGGQSGSRIAGSHEIVNRGAQSTGVTGRTDRSREGNYPETRVEEKKKKKERRRTKKGREKGAACQCCPVHG